MGADAPISQPRILSSMVLQLKWLPTGDAGAWIATARFPGVQWDVALDALDSCDGREGSAVGSGRSAQAQPPR